MPDDLTGLGRIADSIERGTRELRQLAYDLAGPGAKELGHLFADKIRIFRVAASIRAMQRAKELIAESGGEQQPVEPKVLVPLIEGASLESEAYLIERWAGLIASAAVRGDVLPSFPRILSELTPEEAHILEFILDRRGPAGGMNREGVDKEELCEALGLPPNSFLLRLQNLHRLQLIEQLTYSGSEPVRGWVQWGPGGHVGLTILGETLVHACRGPGQGAA